MIATDCPSREQLAAYSNGLLDDETSEQIAAHLDHCQTCQATLTGLGDADDTFVSRLRQLPPPDRYEREEDCLRAEVGAKAKVAALLAEQHAAGAAGHDSSGSIHETALGVGPALGAGCPTPPSFPSEGLPLQTLGEYQLLEKLGEGGMGTVYKALQTKLDKTVALKVLPQQRTADTNAVARFEREMKAIGRLEHPNIVRALDAREIDGTHLLVMEYVAGIDLGEVSRSCGPLRIADACEVVRQAAEGLQYAHEQGLVHRDIKPSNLILAAAAGHRVAHVAESLRDSDRIPDRVSERRGYVGIVKILDLGLALLGTNQPSRPEMTAAGTAMGTADYVAPEQVSDSHSVDIRADIYSLGCTLYKLLSGRPPFVGPPYKSPMEKMLAHLSDTPPPITLLRSDVSPELAAVIERMMAKKPEDRFATPGEVARALEPFAAGCDLGRLLNEANGMVGLPTVEAPPSASTGKLSASPHSDTGVRPSAVAPDRRAGAGAVSGVLMPSGPEPNAKPSAAAGPAFGARRPLWIALAAAAASFLLIALGVILIRIRDKDGRETVIQAPPGSTVTLEQNGKQVAQVPAPADDAKPLAEQPVANPITTGKPGERPKPVTPKLTPEPLEIKPGEPLSELALVAQPAPLPGVRSWTIETRGHRGAISSIAYRPDGTQLLTAGDDGTVRIWDTTDGHLVRALVGASAPAIWSPDGSLVAACVPRNALVIAGLAWPIPIPKYAITIWDAEAGRILKTIPLDNPVLRMDWSPDGNSLAATVVRFADPTRVSYLGGPYLTTVLDIESGRCQSVLPERGNSMYEPRARTRSIRWSPDGAVLAETFPDGVRRWDVLARKPLPDLPLGYAADCCWSPDGTQLFASGALSLPPGETRVWEIATGKQISEANPKVVAVDWLPDGKTIVARAGEHEWVLLDAATGGLRRKLSAEWYRWNQHNVSRWGNDGPAGTSPDGKFLVSVSGPSLSIIDVDSGGTYLRIPGHLVQVRRMGWSPDGARLGVSGGAPGVPDSDHGAFWIFDGGSGHLLKTVGSTYHRFCAELSEWSPDGKTISWIPLGSPPKRFLWDTVSDSLVRELDAAPTLCFAWSPDGKRLAAWNNIGKGEVEIINTDSGQSLKTLTHGLLNNAHWANLTWSPSGKILVVSCCDVPNATSIWDVESGSKLGQLSGRVFALAFSPDGEMIAAGFDNGAIARCEAASGKVIDHFQKSETPVVSLHWSRDGKRIFSGTVAGEICEWDCQSGQVVRTVSGVVPETFCPDGKYVGYPRKAGGTVGGSRPVAPFARIWETETGQPQGTIVLLSDDAWLTLAADGHYCSSTGVQQQLIYVIQTDAGQETLTPDEFAQRFGWKNDPDKVTLTGEPSGPPPAETPVSAKDAGESAPAEPAKAPEAKP